MAIRSGIFCALQETFLKYSHKENRYEVPTNSAIYHCIRPNGQIIHILSGNAWITYNGKDILLEAGQEIQLPRTRREAIISAIGSETMSFEIIHHNGKGV